MIFKLWVSSFLALSFSAIAHFAWSSGSQVTVVGVVLEKATNEPLADIEIGLYDLAESKLSMSLPENIEIDRALSDGEGKFQLNGKVGKKFIVGLIDKSICWIPFSRVYESKELGKDRTITVTVVTAEYEKTAPCEV